MSFVTNIILLLRTEQILFHCCLCYLLQVWEDGGSIVLQSRRFTYYDARHMKNRVKSDMATGNQSPTSSPEFAILHSCLVAVLSLTDSQTHAEERWMESQGTAISIGIHVSVGYNCNDTEKFPNPALVSPLRALMLHGNDSAVEFITVHYLTFLLYMPVVGYTRIFGWLA